MRPLLTRKLTPPSRASAPNRIRQPRSGRRVGAAGVVVAVVAVVLPLAAVGEAVAVVMLPPCGLLTS